MNPGLLYIISPYAGDVEKNKAFAIKCCHHAIRQGCTPIAPYLLYSQILNDQDPTERSIGLRLGLDILEHCTQVWVCGATISSGMADEIKRAELLGLPILYMAEVP